MLGREYAWLVGGIVLLLYIMYCGRNEKHNKSPILYGLFIVYITVVVSLTFFPLVYINDGTKSIQIALIMRPFRTISNFLKYAPLQFKIEQLLGNVLLTVPLGIFLPLMLKKPRPYKVLLIILAFTVTIETLQLAIGAILGSFYRVCDIDDVILNFFGGTLGYLVFLPFKHCLCPKILEFKGKFARRKK